MKFETEIFSQFNNRWALLSAGTKDHHNTMTISWGGMGTLWEKPVVTVYVKPCRNTFRFMNQYEYFTVSFYPDDCRKALTVMGSISGRDTDKDAEAGLHVKDLAKAITYEEAEVTLLCRRIYWQDLDEEHMPGEVVKLNYLSDDPHRMYIGEVIEILR
ncbi:MAG: flavin reductase [Solobacterium sp.]|nr:flavin reductase [Solobacterium sp.]MBR2768308.1 flavin reductase [Solobacterium sp.]